jgi:hypothetical protein
VLVVALVVETTQTTVYPPVPVFRIKVLPVVLPEALTLSAAAVVALVLLPALVLMAGRVFRLQCPALVLPELEVVVAVVELVALVVVVTVLQVRATEAPAQLTPVAVVGVVLPLGALHGRAVTAGQVL